MKDFLTDDEMDSLAAADTSAEPPDFVSEDEMDAMTARAKPAAPPTYEQELDRISKGGVEKDWLREQAQWQGFHPEEEADAQIRRGEHGAHLAGSARAAVGSVVGEGLLRGLPSWVRKKLGTPEEQAALDELRKVVDERKGILSHVREGIVGGIPTAAATKALGLGKAGSAALNVADTAASSALETDTGEEGEGALMGGGIAAGAELATNVVLPGVAKLAKKALPALGGVKRANIDAYLERPEAIRNAATTEEIKDLADASADRIAATRARAAEALAARETAQKEFGDEMLRSLEGEKARRAAELQDAWNRKVDELRGAKPPEELRQEILDDLAGLRRDVSERSAKSFEALGDTDFGVPVPRLKGYLTSVMNELKVAGVEPIGAAGESFGKLAGYREFLDRIGEKTISAQDAKRLVQMIDADTEALYHATAGRYTPPAGRALRGFRSHIDETLKESPAYAQAMGGLGDDVKLLKRMVDDGFGDEESLAQLLRAVSGPKGEFTLKTLDEFGKKTGKDYVGKIRQYLDARQTLSSRVGMDEARRGLPEHAALERAEQVVAEFAPNRRETAAMLLPSGKEQRALEDATAAHDALAGWSHATSENKLKSVMAGRSIENRRAVEALEKQTGLPFSQMLADRRVADAFEKGYMHGSRNVNLWSLVGALFGGSALFKDKEPLFKFGGGLVGGAIDAAGPKMTQKLLDTFLAIKGSKYAPVLERAYQRGPDALTATHLILLRSDPDYRATFAQPEGGAQP